MRSYPILIATFLGSVMLIECVSTVVPATDLRGSILESLAVQVALTHYESFESLAGRLTDEAISFCEAPTSEGLEKVKDAWWSARIPWKHNELISFGPALMWPGRYRSKIDRWPAIPDRIETFIASEPELMRSDFELMGAYTRGLPVIEYLLWNESTNPLTAFRDNPLRCEYLVGLATDVEINAGRLVNEWKQDWVPKLTNPQSIQNSDYSTPEGVLAEWVTGMVFAVEGIYYDKLGKSMGDISRRISRLDWLESRPSARSLTDARDVLSGVYAIWTGDVNGDNLGVIDLVQSPILVERIETLFTDAEDQLAAIPESLEATLLNQPERIISAQDSLESLYIALRTELTKELGVRLIFFDFFDLDDD